MVDAFGIFVRNSEADRKTFRLLKGEEVEEERPKRRKKKKSAEADSNPEALMGKTATPDRFAR